MHPSQFNPSKRAFSSRQFSAEDFVTIVPYTTLYTDARQPVRSCMTNRVVFVREQDHLEKAIHLMNHFNIKQIPVINNDGHPVGMIWREDVKKRYPLQKWPIASIHLVLDMPEKVADVMDRNFHKITTGATIASAVNRLVKHDVNALLVVSPQLQIQGLITRSDIVNALLAENVGEEEVVYAN